MSAQHGKLDVQSRVEHHVCCFLEGEYPLVLSFTDTLPLADCLSSREGTLVIVTDNTTQQAIILRRNPVVIIERDTCQGRDIDSVFQSVRNILCQQRIQGVNSLNDKNTITRKTELLTIILTLTPAYLHGSRNSRR